MAKKKRRREASHRTVGQTFFFSAAHARGSALTQMVSQLVDSAFSGSAEGLVQALLHGGRLSEDEEKRIEKLIRAARRRRKSR